MLHETKPYVVESLFVGAVVVEWVYCLLILFFAFLS